MFEHQYQVARQDIIDYYLNPKKRVKSGKSWAGIRQRQQGLTKVSIKRCSLVLTVQ